MISHIHRKKRLSVLHRTERLWEFSWLTMLKELMGDFFSYVDTSQKEVLTTQ